MQIFDTHSHYNLEPFSADWKTHWQEAQNHGVVGSLVIGTTFAESSLATQIANEDPRLGASIGIHPYEYIGTVIDAVQRNDQDFVAAEEASLKDVATDIEELRLILDPRKVLAIGETGLDYFRLDSYTEPEVTLIKKIQQTGLRAHIKLAQSAATPLPLVLHVRDKNEDAYYDVLKILKEEKVTSPFILHCVSGPLKYVQEALEMGGYVSLAGNVTYKSAEHLRDIARMVPADRLLTETDAPFLPPVPFRGKECQPWMIENTAEYLVKELGISSEKLLENSYRLFPTLHSQV